MGVSAVGKKERRRVGIEEGRGEGCTVGCIEDAEKAVGLVGCSNGCSLGQ